MRVTSGALLSIAALIPATATAAICELPINADDFNEPAWETIMEQAFPVWEVPGSGCPKFDSIGGDLVAGSEEFPTPEDKKFNSCYYTKAYSGLDPKKGGYPTPMDTFYAYEFAAPFFKQPGDGTSHHCSSDTVNIAECPKIAESCGGDCVTITNEYGIGHIPPFVPLAAVQKKYQACETDVCSTWFHYETNGCRIKKSVMDELVYEYFGEGTSIQFQPPILLNGVPSSTYFRPEYGGESPACDDGNCRGPHYCSKDVADAGIIWGDFCPYVHTGDNSGKYRHPHIALAALELWIANECMPDMCPKEWLDSPNGAGYGTDEMSSTSNTWCEMDNNADPMAQPLVPYKWPNSGNGSFPGLELYGNNIMKAAPGMYMNNAVNIKSLSNNVDLLSDGDITSAAGYSITRTTTMAWLLGTAIAIVGMNHF
jgi:hypothetical protein